MTTSSFWLSPTNGAAEREGSAVLAAVPLEEVVRDGEVAREGVHLHAAGAEGATERHPETVDLRVEAGVNSPSAATTVRAAPSGTLVEPGAES